MKTWIQNGHVLDPLTGTDQIYDVLVDGKDIKNWEPGKRSQKF